MKLCWDNIENIRLNRNNFKDIIKKITYYYIDSCNNCGEPFLNCRKNGSFCSNECFKLYNKGENTYMYGKKHTDESKKKISKGNKNKIISNETREKISKANTGKKRSKEIKKKLSDIHKGRVVTKETREKISKANTGKKRSKETKKKISDTLKNIKKQSSKYWSNNIPFYDTYAPQLEWAEEVRRNQDDSNVLEVKCFKCDEWFIPSYNNVKNRIRILKDDINYHGEHRFYCSNQCRYSCSIYGKTPEMVMKEDAIRAGRLNWIELEREVQPELRQMVLERDEHKCVKCGETENIQCHHIYPVNIEPLLSADMDNCITLCVECHKEVHTKDGCRYDQLHMEEC